MEVTVRQQAPNFGKSGWARHEGSGTFARVSDVGHQARSGNRTVTLLLDRPGAWIVQETWYGKVSRRTVVV